LGCYVARNILKYDITSASRLIFNGAGLLACAVFITGPYRDLLLTALLLFLPLWDTQWRQSVPLQILAAEKSAWALSITFLIALALFTFLVPLQTIVTSVALTALPEEWFFRAYLLSAMCTLTVGSLHANILTSALFTAAHLPTQGIIGVLVFIPSLLFGWVYIKTRSIITVVCLHTIANLLYLHWGTILINKFYKFVT
jgi:membrane protease YdiL (CAAX protease family)